jgi:hypothetical protein
MDKPLSPAAQAVLDAVEDDCIHPTDLHRIAAAALRAVAVYCTREQRILLTIAAELEGGDD